MGIPLELIPFLHPLAITPRLGVEFPDFGKEADTAMTCSPVGKQLAYSVSLATGGELVLYVSNVDGLDEPQRILRGVKPSDWQVIAKTISALEYARVDSVAKRPLEVVDRSGTKWVIA